MSHTSFAVTVCFTGIFSRPLLDAVRGAGECLCVLLRAYISHRQTSEQGCRWSRRSESRW